MKRGYTAGPWPIERTGDGKRYIIGKGLVEGPNGYEVAEVYSDDCDQDEAAANARLIAAAPETHEALALVAPVVCRAICPYGGTGGEQNWPHDPICQQVSAALAKASIP